jgi:hypothetical protein
MSFDRFEADLSFNKYNLKFRVQTMTKNFRYTAFVCIIHLLKIL